MGKTKIDNTNVIKPYAPYSGSKGRIIPHLIPFFQGTDTLIDLFCGTGSVFINSGAKNVVAYEIEKSIVFTISTLRFFGLWKNASMYKQFLDLLDEYSEVDYYELRGMFNETGFPYRSEYYSWDSVHPISMLIVLQHRSFNSLLRFNSRGEFNAPEGRKDFVKESVIEFIDALGQLETFLISLRSIQDMNIQMKYGENCTVYADPPYFVTDNTSYYAGWSWEQEESMRRCLETQIFAGNKIVLSNVTRHNNIDNLSLIEWARSNDLFIYEAEKGYNSWSAAVGSVEKKPPSMECVITNFEADLPSNNRFKLAY